MTSLSFDRFVNFGAIADKTKRAQFAAAIYEALQKKPGGSTGLSNAATDNFAEAVENILSNETLRELCSRDPSLAEHITQDILDFTNKTKRQIQKTENPFENEQQLFNTFEQMEAKNFEEAWETVSPFLQDTYTQDALDTVFYYEEFRKSLAPQKEAEKDRKNRKSISFQSVKEHFMGRWEKLLFQKKIKWELELIEEHRKKFCEELYKQIEDLKKLQELLEPFANELGRLWDMSKGRWQNVNFEA